MFISDVVTPQTYREENPQNTGFSQILNIPRGISIPRQEASDRRKPQTSYTRLRNLRSEDLRILISVCFGCQDFSLFLCVETCVAQTKATVIIHHHIFF